MRRLEERTNLCLSDVLLKQSKRWYGRVESQFCEYNVLHIISGEFKLQVRPMGRSSNYKFLMPLFLTHNIFRELRDIQASGMPFTFTDLKL